MSTYHAQDSLIYDVLNVGAFSVIVKSSRTFDLRLKLYGWGTREIHPKVDSKTQNMSPVWAMTPISRQHWLHSNMTGCLKTNERVY